jgi:hypothetical protein
MTPMPSMTAPNLSRNRTLSMAAGTQGASPRVERSTRRNAMYWGGGIIGLILLILLILLLTGNL